MVAKSVWVWFLGCDFNNFYKWQLFLCGFSEEQLEKLIRVINKGGGVRYGVMSDAVTHVVVGDRGGGPKDEVDSGYDVKISPILYHQSSCSSLLILFLVLFSCLLFFPLVYCLLFIVFLFIVFLLFVVFSLFVVIGC